MIDDFVLVMYVVENDDCIISMMLLILEKRKYKVMGS